VTLAYCLGTSAVVLVYERGTPAAVLLLVFAPGYLLTTLLFPRKDSIDWIERFALSLGFSVAVVPLLALLLNFTEWGVRLVPLILAVLFFSLTVGMGAYAQRLKLAPLDRLSATIELTRPTLRDYGVAEKALVVVLTVSILLAGSTLFYLVTTPAPAGPFTQFFIEGPGGNTSGYTTRLNISQPGTVLLGIINHESANVNYTIRVDLVGVEIVFNSSRRTNETREVNRTTWSMMNLTLANGQNWSLPYTFQIDSPGVWKVQFLLFRDENFSSSYRELHMFVRVS